MKIFGAAEKNRANMAEVPDTECFSAGEGRALFGKYVLHYPIFFYLCVARKLNIGRFRP
ncbi:hypothetical protein LJC45_02395 [Alistipes sp. OttesenSCG-928-B03]|nr:hypothetical protein [Alistipes sp. OttesenSCG-928-B03]